MNDKSSDDVVGRDTKPENILERPSIVRLTPLERVEFVKGLLSKEIFTVQHVPNESAFLLPLIFMPIGMGVFSEAPDEYKAQIGTIYAYMSEAGARVVNGFPIFRVARVVHKDDWIEILKVFVEEHNALDKALMERFGVETTPS